jgi:hypothetical protein
MNCQGHCKSGVKGLKKGDILLLTTLAERFDRIFEEVNSENLRVSVSKMLANHAGVEREPPGTRTQNRLIKIQYNIPSLRNTLFSFKGGFGSQLKYKQSGGWIISLPHYLLD